MPKSGPRAGEQRLSFWRPQSLPRVTGFSRRPHSSSIADSPASLWFGLCVQATRMALAAEEPRVARLQAQLKELIALSCEPQPLSDSVVAALQEFQRYPHRGRRGSGSPLNPRRKGGF